MGGLAFMMACVAHEAAGHGGACLISGGRVLLLTSVYFRCTPGRAVVDAAGPLMNLAVAGLAMSIVRRSRPVGCWRPFAALVAAFNALWGAGYFLYSAVTDEGDWAFVLRDFHAEPRWAWRVLFGVPGIWLYTQALRATSPHLPRGAPLAWAYLAGGAVALTSASLSAGPILPALREAAQEGLLASGGLLYLALVRTSSLPASPPPVGHPLTLREWLLGLGLLLAFLAVMGPGFRGA